MEGEEGRKFKSGKERRERDKQAINLLNRSLKIQQDAILFIGKMYENITLKSSVKPQVLIKRDLIIFKSHVLIFSTAL